MALITSIRKHFWFVLILLGLALASFVIMDIVNSGNGGGSGRASLTLGEVGGDKISYNDFQTTENVYYKNSQVNPFQIKDLVWNYFVEKSIVENEASDLGLAVSTDELMDLQYGDNLSPIIESNWKNQQTNQVDRTRLGEVRAAIDAGQLNPNFRGFWAEQAKQIRKAKLQNKISTMVAKSIYLPKWMGDQANALGKDQIKMAYVKVPFASLTEPVELSDSDYSTYMNDNKSLYEIDEESRIIESYSFNVISSKEDSTKLYGYMTESKMTFVSSTDDSLYAVNNNGSYANFYFEEDKMPASIKGAIVELSKGDAYGPYLENGAYNVVKLIDKKVIADSVKASHILRSVDYSIPGNLASTRKYIDSLRLMIDNGADFADLAKTNSQDPGSGSKGGDLGYFVQGTMLPAFNDACFYSDSKNLKIVETKYGIHLIKVVDKKFLNQDMKYKLAFIRSVIVPSEETQNSVYEKVSSLLTENSSVDALKAAAIKEGGELVISDPTKQNDFKIKDLGEGQETREIIRWAFGESVDIGGIAPEVFSFSDKVNYFNNKYVLSILKQISPAGMPSVESMKSSLENEVRNFKRAHAIEGSIGNDLNQIASKYGIKVDTAANVSFTAAFVSGIGTEPKMMAEAFKMNVGDAAKVVVGESALFVFKVIDKTEGADVSSLPQFRNSERDNKRRTIEYGLMNSLKKEIDIKDNRATFF